MFAPVACWVSVILSSSLPGKVFYIYRMKCIVLQGYKCYSVVSICKYFQQCQVAMYDTLQGRHFMGNAIWFLYSSALSRLQSSFT